MTDNQKLNKIIDENEITCVIHLAALLSSIAEKMPDLAIDINVKTIYPILKVIFFIYLIFHRWQKTKA